MSEICLTVRVAVRDGHTDEAAAHLRILRQETRKEPGNIAYDVYRSTETPNVFFLHERYLDQAALDAHRASAHFQEHGKNGLYLWVEDRRAEYYAPLEG